MSTLPASQAEKQPKTNPSSTEELKAEFMQVASQSARVKADSEAQLREQARKLELENSAQEAKHLSELSQLKAQLEQVCLNRPGAYLQRGY